MEMAGHRRMLTRMRIAAVIAAVVTTEVYYFARSFGVFDLLRFLNETAEIPFNESECARVAAQIVAGRRTPDATGLVVLPANLSNVTKDGHVYVTHKRNGLLLVLFPTWRGHD